MKMLIINAHPKIKSTSSVTLNVLDHFLKVYKELNPSETIEQIDLYSEEVPMVDQTVLSAWEKLAQGEQITAEEQKVTSRMAEVLQQFKSANKYVIAMPLHNFNIPTKLKDYMDNIFIARETFKYTENGSVGLLNDGRSILVIQGSGGVYTNNDWYTEVEYSHKYLKSMFNFLGLEDYQIIRAQGTAIRNREVVLEEAYKDADQAAKHLSGLVRS
ncbi:MULTISPECIES: FMN-dependent NADH-azoreductase [unclassified Paenibacillus]|uniref:FMN-dependent NADH-azoreductase n=1 Tax=unclassified Paenibacillus TaxID=185978 RepID=UPI00277EB3F3|nr:MULTISPECIES: NAD(P)H-dependent oxidoreductase [unclassified Paenibacillus]MDQ0899105.1 FMN-dependent NADH-azoreductase [Paenibacillus sp. V4I7]MDQ0914912.1 FMN-dependent NADH-azoreductase [Paenibacillus sp. V4I5]